MLSNVCQMVQALQPWTMSLQSKKSTTQLCCVAAVSQQQRSWADLRDSLVPHADI
jgi:hypothetical protein